MTMSNALNASAFTTNPAILIQSWLSPTFELPASNSPEIVFHIPPTSKTLAAVASSALTLLYIPKGTIIADLAFQSGLLVQIRLSPEAILAETWLEGLYEYGTGAEPSEAVTDLILSLGEYLQVLEARKETLGDSARRELDTLHMLVKPKA